MVILEQLLNTGIPLFRMLIFMSMSSSPSSNVSSCWISWIIANSCDYDRDKGTLFAALVMRQLFSELVLSLNVLSAQIAKQLFKEIVLSLNVLDINFFVEISVCPEYFFSEDSDLCPVTVIMCLLGIRALSSTWTVFTRNEWLVYFLDKSAASLRDFIIDPILLCPRGTLL